MQKITLSFKGEGSLRLNAHGHQSIEIAKGKSHVFNNAMDYKPYSAAALAWKNAGLDILVEDSSKQEVKAEPKQEVKAKAEPKQEAKPEHKEHPHKEHKSEHKEHPHKEIKAEHKK